MTPRRPLIFLQDRRRRAAAGGAGDRHPIEQQGMAQRDIGFGKPHTLQPVVGLGQFTDADVGASKRDKIHHGIERFRLVDELDSDASARPICCAISISGPSSAPSGRAHMKRRQIEARNGHAQNLASTIDCKSRDEPGWRRWLGNRRQNRKPDAEHKRNPSEETARWTAHSCPRHAAHNHRAVEGVLLRVTPATR